MCNPGLHTLVVGFPCVLDITPFHTPVCSFTVGLGDGTYFPGSVFGSENAGSWWLGTTPMNPSVLIFSADEAGLLRYHLECRAS